MARPATPDLNSIVPAPSTGLTVITSVNPVAEEEALSLESDTRETIPARFARRMSSLSPVSTIKKYFRSNSTDKNVDAVSVTEDVSVVATEPRPISSDEEATGDEENHNREGDIYANDPAAAKFKSCNWYNAGFLMVAETISLGILSLPSAIAKIGLVPGIISIIILGLLATYSGLVIGQWKRTYMHTMSFADVGHTMGGKWLGRLFGLAAILSFIFICAAHILTFSVMMNVLTGHATCSIVFGLIGTLLSILLSIPRTSKDISWISVGAFASILTATLVVMISVGVTRPGGVGVQIVKDNVELAPAFIGILNIMLAYAGNAAFFNFVTELKDPRDFWKSLVMLQSIAISIYVTVGVVIYYYVGSAVKSPALTSAAPTIRKIAYGIAIPTIVVAGVINGHVAAKQLFTTFWIKRGQPQQCYLNTTKSWVSWISILLFIWIVSWVLAEAIPIFEQLLGLVSALFMSWFTYGLCGIMWIYMNKGRLTKGWKQCALLVLNICMIIIGAGSCGLGLYATGWELARNGVTGKPFSCADNSIH